MPNFKSISFEMTDLEGAGRICPPLHVSVIQKNPRGIGLHLTLGVENILLPVLHGRKKPISDGSFCYWHAHCHNLYSRQT